MRYASSIRSSPAPSMRRPVVGSSKRPRATPSPLSSSLEAPLSKTNALVLLPDEPLPLSRRLEALFERQVKVLPDTTQQFLLVAAAEPTDVDLVWEAAERLGLHADAADAAIAAGLFDPKVSRPSAIPSSAQPLTPQRTPQIDAGCTKCSPSWSILQRRTPERGIARLLQLGQTKRLPLSSSRVPYGRRPGVGGRRVRRSSLAAADLTPEASQRTDGCWPQPKQRWWLGKYQGRKRSSSELRSPSASRVRLLMSSVLRRRSFPLLNRERCRRPCSKLPGRWRPSTRLKHESPSSKQYRRASFLRNSRRARLHREVGFAALGLARERLPASTIEDAMLEGFATRFAIGYVEAVPALRRVVKELCSASIPAAGLTRWAILGANAAADLWDCHGYRDLCVRLEHAERACGALESLHITLGTLAHSLMWAGDFASAESAHSEATEIAVALGSDAATFDALKIELFAWQGRDEDTRFVAELLTGEFVTEIGGGVAMNLARVALGILDLAEGRYEEALANASAVVSADPCPHGSQALPDVVEAAMRSGEHDTARHALDRLRQRAQASGMVWGLGLLARSEALVVSEPEPHFKKALDLLGQTYIKTDLARAHLLYGEWLRREKRLSDARGQLRTAFTMFDAMGALAFAERARRELAATGEGTRRRSIGAVFELTPQERHIALLAANGATNQEIASQLFLSAATVDYHLRKVFRKLSIGSRRQLASKLRIGVP